MYGLILDTGIQVLQQLRRRNQLAQRRGPLRLIAGGAR
jgi:hypothetical protein